MRPRVSQRTAPPSRAASTIEGALFAIAYLGSDFDSSRAPRRGAEWGSGWLATGLLPYVVLSEEALDFGLTFVDYRKSEVRSFRSTLTITHIRYARI